MKWLVAILLALPPPCAAAVSWYPLTSGTRWCYKDYRLKDGRVVRTDLVCAREEIVNGSKTVVLESADKRTAYWISAGPAGVDLHRFRRPGLAGRLTVTLLPPMALLRLPAPAGREWTYEGFAKTSWGDRFIRASCKVQGEETDYLGLHPVCTLRVDSLFKVGDGEIRLLRFWFLPGRGLFAIHDGKDLSTLLEHVPGDGLWPVKDSR